MSESTAVVLAAGLGTRMQAGRAVPKPLVELAGRPILARTLETLARGGVCRVVVVLGYRADELRSALDRMDIDGLAIETVLNPLYELSNGVSVLAAREKVGDRFLLTMSDHLLDPAIVKLALQTDPGEGLVLCIDRKIDTIFDMDDATKVATRDDRIVRIGKELASFDAVDTGVFHASRGLLEALATVFERCGNCSLSDGVQALAAQGLARTADIGPLAWQDIDTEEMLAEAQQRLAAARGDD